MAIKLFNRKPEERNIIYADVWTRLDKLMGEMASIDIYIEYLEQREGMQLSGAAPQDPTFVKHLRCDLYHPGIIRMDLLLSVLSGIVGTTTKGTIPNKQRKQNGKDNRPNCWLTVHNRKEQSNWHCSGSSKER